MEEINKSGLTLGEAQGLVDASIRDVKDGFVATGYYLWLIREVPNGRRKINAKRSKPLKESGNFFGFS